jgi:hypothetical protein
MLFCRSTKRERFRLANGPATMAVTRLFTQAFRFAQFFPVSGRPQSSSRSLQSWRHHRTSFDATNSGRCAARTHATMMYTIYLLVGVLGLCLSLVSLSHFHLLFDVNFLAVDYSSREFGWVQRPVALGIHSGRQPRSAASPATLGIRSMFPAVLKPRSLGHRAEARASTVLR